MTICQSPLYWHNCYSGGLATLKGFLPTLTNFMPLFFTMSSPPITHKLSSLFSARFGWFTFAGLRGAMLRAEALVITSPNLHRLPTTFAGSFNFTHPFMRSPQISTEFIVHSCGEIGKYKRAQTGHISYSDSDLGVISWEDFCREQPISRLKPKCYHSVLG